MSEEINIDNNLKNYVKLISVLEGTKTIVVKEVLPDKKYEDCNELYDACNRIVNDLNESDKKFLEKYKNKPTLLSSIDLLRVRRLFKLQNNELNSLIDIRNEIIHEGKDLVASDDDYEAYYKKLEEALKAFKVPSEVIEEKAKVPTNCQELGKILEENTILSKIQKLNKELQNLFKNDEGKKTFNIFKSSVNNSSAIKSTMIGRHFTNLKSNVLSKYKRLKSD